jgi:hypothetical protein
METARAAVKTTADKTFWCSIMGRAVWQKPTLLTNGFSRDVRGINP